MRLGTSAFRVSAKNDELLIKRRFHRNSGNGALLGVEVKKILDPEVRSAWPSTSKDEV